MVKLNALPLVLRIKQVIHCPGSIPHLFNATCDERRTRYMRFDGLGALCLTVCSPRETLSFWWDAHAAPTQLAQDLQIDIWRNPGL